MLILNYPTHHMAASSLTEHDPALSSLSEHVSNHHSHNVEPPSVHNGDWYPLAAQIEYIYIP